MATATENLVVGLSDAEAAERRARYGPNAVREHRARPVRVLVRQLRSPLLLLLFVTAVGAVLLGERVDGLIVAVILAASVLLGFVNEYRAARTGEALHDRLRHRAYVRRSGRLVAVDVVDLVPGDVVRLDLGTVVPADLRVLAATGLECDESVITGEAVPVVKNLGATALMGAVVCAGTGMGVVVATGGRTAFGRIALGLGEREPETEFQRGLRRFSGLLMQVALVLVGAIVAINLLLRRPLIEALLFALAIAVGITPQLLPAIVTASLSAGSRRLAARRVLIKRLVCIEDLGDVEVLFTDKTGTLTEGRISFQRALGPSGGDGTAALTLAAASLDPSDTAAANPLDKALYDAITRACGDATTGARTHTGASTDARTHTGASAVDGATPAASTAQAAIAAAGAVDASTTAPRYVWVAGLPFDHERRMASALVDGPDGRVLIVKGGTGGRAGRLRRRTGGDGRGARHPASRRWPGDRGGVPAGARDGGGAPRR